MGTLDLYVVEETHINTHVDGCLIFAAWQTAPGPDTNKHARTHARIPFQPQQTVA